MNSRVFPRDKMTALLYDGTGPYHLRPQVWTPSGQHGGKGNDAKVCGTSLR